MITKPKKKRTTVYLDDDVTEFCKANKGKISWFLNKKLRETKEFQEFLKEREGVR